MISVYLLLDLPHIKEEIHRKLEILDAFADFLDAFAEIFLALSVRGLTMQRIFRGRKYKRY